MALPKYDSRGYPIPSSTPSAMNYNSGPYAAPKPTPSAMDYNTGPYAAPKPTPNAMNLNAAPYAAPTTPKATTTPQSTYTYNPYDADFKMPSDTAATVPKTNTYTAAAETYPGTPAIQETYTAEPSGPSVQDIINQMLEAQRQSRIAALDKARQNALASIETERAGVAPRYYDARNQAAAQSDVQALNFAQMAAGMGIKGGAGAMPEIYRNSALQGNLGNLNRQEQATYDALDRNRTGIQNAYEQDRLAALADIDAQGLQAYINQMNADRAYDLQLGTLTGSIGGTPTLESKRFEADEAYRNKTFDEQVEQFRMTYGLDLRKMNLEEAQQKIDNAFRQQQITQQQAQDALAAAKFAYQKEQDEKLFNYNAEQDTLNRQADQATAQTKATEEYSNYLQQGLKMLSEGTYDNVSEKTINRYTPQQVISWINSLPLSPQQKADLANELGI